MEDDRVMSFDDWCKLNGFSRSTGQRIIAAGNGPTFIKLVAERVTHLAKCPTCRERLRTGRPEHLEVARAQPVAQPYQLVPLPASARLPRPVTAPLEREHRRAA